MIVQSILGKRIVKVKQTRVFVRKEWITALDWIELDNGIRLYGRVAETESDYVIELLSTKPERRN